MVRRVVRNVALVCVGGSGAAWLWAPDRPLVALGVLGGGVLAVVAIWALAGVAHSVGGGAETGEISRVSWIWHLVKFFTRHAILAVAAYVMMVRLHLDPVGMLVGVTSVVVAAALEAARPR